MPIICIDGINGSGKTTQAKLLAERVLEEVPGAEPFVFAEPGVRPDHNAEQLRVLARMGEWKHCLTRAMLFMAARCELVAEMYEIQDNSNAWIILDRYTPSFCAYQLNDFLEAYEGDVSSAINMINMLHDMIGAPTPDLTFILDVDPMVGIKRYRAVAHDDPDVFERSMATTYSLYYRYHQLMASWSSYRSLGDLYHIKIGEMSASGVHEHIWAALCQYLKEESTHVQG